MVKNHSEKKKLAFSNTFISKTGHVIFISSVIGLNVLGSVPLQSTELKNKDMLIQMESGTSSATLSDIDICAVMVWPVCVVHVPTCISYIQPE